MGFLEIKHLNMIRAISEAGTLTRAAQSLFLSQSALSQQLKDIETKLQARLFYRTRKQMLLTPMGKKVRDTAERVIQSLEETETDIARMVNGETGELKVGTQCIFCYRWLPKVLGEFQDRFPNVELEIGNSLNAAKELEKGTYNLVVSVLPETSDNAAKIPLFRDEMVAILGPDLPLAQKEYIELTDFDGENLISIRPRARNWFYRKTLKSRGITPKRFLVVEDPAAMMEMTAAGFGMAMAPRWAVRSLVETGRVKALSVTKPGLFLTWQAMFLKNDPALVFLREFIRLVGRSGP